MIKIRQLLACLNVSVFDSELERPLKKAAEKVPHPFFELCSGIAFGIVLACVSVLLSRRNAAAGTAFVCFATAAGTAGVLFPPKIFSRVFYWTALFSLPVWETANAVRAIAAAPFSPPSALSSVTVAVQAAALIAVLWRDMDFKEKFYTVCLFLMLAVAIRLTGAGFAELMVVFSIAFFTDAAAAGRAAQVLFAVLFLSALLTMRLSADAAAGLIFAAGLLFKGTALRLKGHK